MGDRPEWVKDVESTPDGTALIVEGEDGVRRGVIVPSQSLVDCECSDPYCEHAPPRRRRPRHRQKRS